jgi:hypothetical protein
MLLSFAFGSYGNITIIPSNMQTVVVQLGNKQYHQAYLSDVM